MLFLKRAARVNTYIYPVIVAFWLGALLAIDVIETPVRVKTVSVPRPYRFVIGARVFKWFAWVQVLFGVVLTTIGLNRHTGVNGGPQFYGALVMLLITLLQAVWIGPSMSKRMIIRASEANSVELDLRPGFTLFHYFYIGADGLKAVLLIFLLSKG